MAALDGGALSLLFLSSSSSSSKRAAFFLLPLAASAFPPTRYNGGSSNGDWRREEPINDKGENAYVGTHWLKYTYVLFFFVQLWRKQTFKKYRKLCVDWAFANQTKVTIK